LQLPVSAENGSPTTTELLCNSILVAACATSRIDIFTQLLNVSHEGGLLPVQLKELLSLLRLIENDGETDLLTQPVASEQETPHKDIGNPTSGNKSHNYIDNEVPSSLQGFTIGLSLAGLSLFVPIVFLPGDNNESFYQPSYSGCANVNVRNVHVTNVWDFGDVQNPSPKSIIGQIASKKGKGGISGDVIIWPFLLATLPADLDTYDSSGKTTQLLHVSSAFSHTNPRSYSVLGAKHLTKDSALHLLSLLMEVRQTIGSNVFCPTKTNHFNLYKRMTPLPRSVVVWQTFQVSLMKYQAC
jgi:hypothetical protein